MSYVFGLKWPYFSRNFLDLEVRSSLKFVSLITEIEDHFKIKFSGDEFHSDAFSTISGLTQLIQNKIQL